MVIEPDVLVSLFDEEESNMAAETTLLFPWKKNPVADGSWHEAPQYRYLIHTPRLAVPPPPLEHPVLTQTRHCLCYPTFTRTRNSIRAGSLRLPASSRRRTTPVHCSQGIPIGQPCRQISSFVLGIQSRPLVPVYAHD